MPSFLTPASSSAGSLGESTTDDSQATDDSEDGSWKETGTDSDSNHSSGAFYRIGELGVSSRQGGTKGGPALDGHQQGGVVRRRRKRRNSTFGKDGGHRVCEAQLAAETDGHTADSSGASSRRFFDRVVAVHWVDGGNGDLAGSFPTNPACLASLAGRRGLAIRVHGTPYQWENSCRPWLAFERDAFLSSLDRFRDAALHAQEGCVFGTNVGGRSKEGRSRGDTLSGDTSIASPSCVDIIFSPSGGGVGPKGVAGPACGRRGVKRVLYFENEEPSLNMHFQALLALDPE